MKFCKDELELIKKFNEPLILEQFRVSLLIASLALYDRLGYTLPGFKRNIGKILKAYIAKKIERVECYLRNHPSYSETKSLIFKMYKKLQSYFPQLNLIPCDLGIQFRLGKEIMIGGKPFGGGGPVSGPKPWYRFEEIKISEWNRKINFFR